ncbi:MAG: cation transporter [Candidatus Latescibacteria bacterium]|nr:cation transporter [Candidatus Latescibacterota bacterium]
MDVSFRNRPYQSHPALSGLRATMMGIVVNTLLAGTKAIAGILGHSHALIADAIESTADIIGSLIVLSGLKIAALPPDVDHPYGHGKAEPLTALVVALTLGVAAVSIAIQSIRGILVPHQAPAPFTLVVLVVVVAIKEGLFRVVSRVSESIASTALKTDAWHHRSDAITSAAAFLGISIALIGGRGYESADDWAALFASFIIAYNAYRLLRPAVSEVMDAAPPASVEMSVRSVASAVDEVTGLEKCLIRKVGVEYYVDLHVLVDGNISVRHGHEVAHRVKDAIRAAHPQVTDVMVHVEPAEAG